MNSEVNSSVDWNKYASERNLTRNRLLFEYHRLITREFIEYFKNIDTSYSLLDVGCGDGFFLNLLRELGFKKIEGVDIADSFLEKAKSKCLKVSKGSIYSLTPDPKYDIVICNDVLEHLDNIDLAVNKLNSTLRYGGILYITVPVHDSISSKIERVLLRRTKLDQSKRYDPTHLQEFSMRSLSDKFEKNGFKIVSSKHVYNPIPIKGRVGEALQLLLPHYTGEFLILIAKKEGKNEI